MDKNKILLENEKLIYSITKHYFKKFSYTEYDFSDFYQNAILFLLENLDKYDSSKGTLKNYINSIIKSSVLDYASKNSRSFYIPKDVIRLSNKLNKKNNLYYLENGKYMSIGEMINYIKEITGFNCIDRAYIDRLLSINYDNLCANRLNIDGIYSYDEDASINIKVEEVTSSNDSFENDTIDKIINENFINYLESLKIDKKNIDIFIERYGFKTGEMQKLCDLASKYGMTHQGICHNINRVKERMSKEKVKKLFF